VKSSAVETVSSEAKVCLGAYGNRKFEFVAIIGHSVLGLFLYFPEMPFIPYSGCLCKCLFAWIKTEQKTDFFFIYIQVFYFFELTQVNLSDPWPNYLTSSIIRSGFKTLNEFY